MTHYRNIELTHDDIKEFQRIYLQEYGEEISYEEAERQAIRFLQFMSHVM